MTPIEKQVRHVNILARGGGKLVNQGSQYVDQSSTIVDFQFQCGEGAISGRRTALINFPINDINIANTKLYSKCDFHLLTLTK